MIWQVAASVQVSPFHVASFMLLLALFTSVQGLWIKVDLSVP